MALRLGPALRPGHFSQRQVWFRNTFLKGLRIIRVSFVSNGFPGLGRQHHFGALHFELKTPHLAAQFQALFATHVLDFARFGVDGDAHRVPHGRPWIGVLVMGKLDPRPHRTAALERPRRPGRGSGAGRRWPPCGRSQLTPGLGGEGKGEAGGTRVATAAAVSGSGSSTPAARIHSTTSCNARPSVPPFDAPSDSDMAQEVD